MGIAIDTLPAPVGLESINARAIFVMAAALGERDSYTHAHAQRVAAYCRRMGLRAGLTGEDLVNVTLGGMLHDVGKLGLSDRIFSHKQASLSQEMIGEVHAHPIIGAQMLSKVKCSPAVSEAVLFHHERMDGSGYPFGLIGREIPLHARMVSIADCFDAITTDRPYQRRKTLAQAMFILKEMAGACLDADLVTLFLEEIQINGIEPVIPAAKVITPSFKVG